MMFRAEPLLKIRLLMLASEAPDAALELARFGVYSPAQYAPEALAENPAAAYREAWLEADSRVAKLLERCGGLPELILPEGAAAPTLTDLEALNTWLREVWTACLAAHEGEARIQEEVQHLEGLQESLSKLEHLNVDLAQLLRPNGLLAVNIGSLPAASVKRASEALAMTGSLLSTFNTIGDQVYAVIAGPRERHQEVRGLLAQAGWRELPVPRELRTHPQAARAWLIEERQRVEERTGAECAAMDNLRGQYRSGLEEARLRVALGRPLAEATVLGVRGRGGLACLSGWIPRRRARELKAALEARFHGQYWLKMEEAQAHEAAQIPSLVRYPRWLLPFVPLVKSYGIPRYGEFDPSLLFELTYLLLFGAMFGDVGHGGVIVLLAVLLYRQLGRTAWVGIGVGVASIGFGWLYGSVFGYEDVLTPIWLSPLHEPTQILSVAILFGVGFIVFTLLANIYNKINAGHLAAALFDSSGVAGLLFYLGATGSIMGWAGVKVLGDSAGFAQLAWGTALLGIAAVAAFKWVETRASLGERAMVTAIETLETGINLFANTLSFMRVAAFSLNHVALALAVFTIANGLGTAGHWLTILLGNAIIIALEGGIVAIQALRLMYFEGFSRFFSGDGTEFIPLKLEGANKVAV
jgi:V/A-type H+-transporting ATPase subunit I